MTSIKITECPRDAMQGIHPFIPTEIKTAYLNLLLKVGFDTLDFGSFVSPKAIPQMADTAQVVRNLDLSNTQTKLLAIIANSRGALEASQFEEIHYLGFPLSISETFQHKNTNASISEALKNIDTIQEICLQKNKELSVYLSMGFGNPYGDAWNTEMVEKQAASLVEKGIKRILLADTIGNSKPDTIQLLVENCSKNIPDIDLGVHLHSNQDTRNEKIESAYLSGCLNFDVAIRGYGGCPMAKDELIGNLATENLISFFKSINIDLNLDYEALEAAIHYSHKVF